MALAALVLTAPAAALGAEAPPTLWEGCESGEGAGQCQLAGGVATNPVDGDVYVVDRLNFRIDEFSVWGSFLKAWGWGVADGANELQTCGPGAAPPTASCRRGLAGAGPGQFSGEYSSANKRGFARGLAVDSTGDLYVYESPNCTGGCGIPTNRVQKFDSDGDFLLMFGGEVNRTTVEEREEQEAKSEPVTVTPQDEDLCTAASHDVCGAGVAGGGDGQFGSGPLVSIEPDSSFIAVGPGNTIYVGGQERVQEFDSEGHFLKSLPVPGEGINALAVDPSGDLYVSFARRNGTEKANSSWPGASKEGVKKLDPAGNPLCTLNVKDPRALATDEAGNVYVADGKATLVFKPLPIRKFDSNCAEDQTFALDVQSGGGSAERATIGIATSSACGIHGAALYYASAVPGSEFLRAYYPHPDPTVCPPPSLPPTIALQRTLSVGAEAAEVQAEINPHFWPDTAYYVQYGTADCRQQPTACQTTTLFPGSALGAEANFPVPTRPVSLVGLSPDTTYHYRFVAKSGGGGPVFGAAEEASGSFTTYPLPVPVGAGCANQTFRVGPSAGLADCRAYEMVSPVGKEGGDIVAQTFINNMSSALDQSAAGGERFTYSSYRPFGDSRSAPFTSQYLAARGPAGWTTASISPPIEGPTSLGNQGVQYVLANAFKFFDPELCSAWLAQSFAPILSPDSVAGYVGLYRRENCGGAAGSYEALTRVSPTYEPTGTTEPLPPNTFLPEVQAFSADGSHVLFTAGGNLGEGAAPCGPEEWNEFHACPTQLYDYHDGRATLVCVSADGVPSHAPCAAGTTTAGFRPNGGGSRSISAIGAISTDGSRVFWTSGEVGAEALGKGKLYVRIDGEETKLITAAAATFWMAAADGSRAIYSIPAGAGSEDLWEWDAEGGSKHLIAHEALGVLGAGKDATHVYFASRAALTGAEENGEGQMAQAGRPNLYLRTAGEAGRTTFIGTLDPSDVANMDASSAINLNPSARTSVVSADGTHAVFTSAAPLTGVDNVDPTNGKPVVEVFLYDATDGVLRCVSCNPGGSAPRLARQMTFRGSLPDIWWAGEIPVWPTQMYASRVLSADGGRVFFDSTEPLVLRDTNGHQDVYEWETGTSQRDCEARGAELYLRGEGGCISLISSGEGPSDSEFLDADASGRDAFFSTVQSLVPQDPGAIDVYDARELGGFPPPPAPRAGCEGSACQTPPSPPPAATPASKGFQGAGNAVRKHPRCPKAKVRRKGHCVQKKRHRRARHHRRDAKHRQRKAKAHGGTKEASRRHAKTDRGGSE